MSHPNPLREKSFVFARSIIRLSKNLRLQHEYEFASQIFRSGTSIGANVEEALRAHSKKDFAAKLSIANKEAAETDYWLRLLVDSEILMKQAIEMRKALDEILKILTAIMKKVHLRIDI